MLATPAFYPTSEQYRIAIMNLTSDAISSEIQLLLPSLYELAALGNAIHELQLLDGSFCYPEVTKALQKQSADLLMQISSSLPGSIAEVLQLRAYGLRGEAQAHIQAALRQIYAPSDPLILLCGPLSTWRGKSRRNLHSVVASVPVHDLNAFIARADSLLAENIRYLWDVLNQPALSVSDSPSFVVTDIITCGGEANTYPKQFSYFLPEDEGVKRAKHKKTIVYANLYNTRFQRVSIPLATELLVPFQQISLVPRCAFEHLLLWFRGHDIGHSLYLPETDYKRLRPLGLEHSIVLQEAMADVIGYLLVTDGPWQKAFDMDIADSSVVFLAELLRYVRRGPNWFPDSAAGFIELSYLLDHGCISLTANGTKLSWDPEQMYNGISALARELIEVVLRADLERSTNLLTKHSFKPEHPLASIVSRLSRDFPHLPDSFAYSAVKL